MITFLNFLSFYITFLPPVIAWYKYATQPRDLKILTCFFYITMIIELGQYLLYKQHQNNIWLINLFSVIEGIFFILLLYLWSKSKVFKRFMIFSMIAFIVFWIETTFIRSSIFVFQDNEKTLKCIIMIFGSCYILTHYAIESTSIIYYEYKFWMITSIMFYFTLTLVVFATSNIILENNTAAYDITYPIHSVVNIITNIFFFIGYLCYIRKVNSYS
jgi:hypothetical protein